MYCSSNVCVVCVLLVCCSRVACVFDTRLCVRARARAPDINISRRSNLRGCGAYRNRGAFFRHVTRDSHNKITIMWYSECWRSAVCRVAHSCPFGRPNNTIRTQSGLFVLKTRKAAAAAAVEHSRATRPDKYQTHMRNVRRDMSDIISANE